MLDLFTVYFLPSNKETIFIREFQFLVEFINLIRISHLDFDGIQFQNSFLLRRRCKESVLFPASFVCLNNLFYKIDNIFLCFLAKVGSSIINTDRLGKSTRSKTESPFLQWRIMGCSDKSTMIRIAECIKFFG